MPRIVLVSSPNDSIQDDTRWLSYAERAEARAITDPPAVRLVKPEEVGTPPWQLESGWALVPFKPWEHVEIAHISEVESGWAVDKEERCRYLRKLGGPLFATLADRNL